MTSEAATPSKPKFHSVPAGRTLVKEGTIQVCDLIWDDSIGEWGEAGDDEIGDDASVYFGVARKS